MLDEDFLVLNRIGITLVARLINLIMEASQQNVREQNSDAEKIEHDEKKTAEQTDQKHDADSGNDTTNEMLQKEKLIDPGNEHSHGSIDHSADNSRSRHDADAGGDGTGTKGSKPE